MRGEREEYYTFHFPVTVTALSRVGKEKENKEQAPFSPAETLTGQLNTVGEGLSLPIKGKTRSCTHSRPYAQEGQPGRLFLA